MQLVTLKRQLEVAVVTKMAARLELDLGVIYGRPFRNLSGGMKQKLLLVMDEPTASLDAHARARFFELCADLERGVTLVLCSHRVDELRQLAEHVVAMDEGRITFDGPVADYLSRDTVPPVSRLVALPPAPMIFNAAPDLGDLDRA